MEERILRESVEHLHPEGEFIHEKSQNVSSGRYGKEEPEPIKMRMR
jgi:hypothetical protein